MPIDIYNTSPVQNLSENRRGRATKVFIYFMRLMLFIFTSIIAKSSKNIFKNYFKILGNQIQAYIQIVYYDQIRCIQGM